MFDSNKDDVYDETFDNINISNNYQETGNIPLVYTEDIIPTSDGSIKRRMRNWHYTIPRNNTSTARFRSGWLNVSLDFLNNEDKRLIFHELNYSYTPSNY